MNVHGDRSTSSARAGRDSLLLQPPHNSRSPDVGRGVAQAKDPRDGISRDIEDRVLAQAQQSYSSHD